MSTGGNGTVVTVATRLLTPEAVVLGFDPAGLPTRLLARLLDVSLQMVLLFGLLIGLGLLSGAGAPEVGLRIAAVFGVPLLLFGYPIIFEALWRGRTPGKAALGLRVVTVEGAPIRFRHAMIRGAADLVDLYGLGILIVAPGVIGAVAISTSKKSQRLGDIVAGTLVVRERAGAPRATPATFAVPRGAELYAATVDVSGLSARDYQTVRSYLIRAGGLRAGARQQVAVELARSIAARIGHLPPPGVSPELFLAVVAANVQARGGERPAVPGAPTARSGWGAAPAATSPPTAVPVAGGWGAIPAWPGQAPQPPGGSTVGAAAPAAPPGPPPPPPAGGGFAAPD